MGYSELSDVSSKLTKLGYNDDYIHRALRVYHKNYGSNYNVEILSEILYRLRVKDQIKAQKKKCNIFHSKINLKFAMKSLQFSNDFILKALQKYQEEMDPDHSLDYF